MPRTLSASASMPDPELEPLVPAGPVTLAQTATERMRVAVLEGRFATGEKLNEELLSSMLQVSRTPVRAALHRLAAEGLLDYVPNRGYSVRTVNMEELNAMFDLRGVLEGLAARLAAERGMDGQQQGIFLAALAEGDRVLSKGRLLAGDRPVFSEVNSRIHGAILRAAGNRMLEDMIRICHNVPASSHRNVLWHDYEWLRRSHDDHHRLFDAIQRREGGRAENLMREHIHTVKLKRGARLESEGRASGTRGVLAPAVATAAKRKPLRGPTAPTPRK